jgi:hypothetical protein
MAFAMVPSRRSVRLYDKLERCIVPMFHGDRDRFADVMLHAIALNGSFLTVDTDRRKHQGCWCGSRVW